MKNKMQMEKVRGCGVLPNKKYMAALGKNGCSERSNSRFRDESLTIEEFENLAAAKALTRIYQKTNLTKLRYKLFWRICDRSNCQHERRCNFLFGFRKDYQSENHSIARQKACFEIDHTSEVTIHLGEDSLDFNSYQAGNTTHFELDFDTMEFSS